MPVLKLPNGQELEYPDGVPPDRAWRVARRKFPNAFEVDQSKADTGFGAAVAAGFRRHGQDVGLAAMAPFNQGVARMARERDLISEPAKFKPVTYEDVKGRFSEGTASGLGALFEHWRDTVGQSVAPMTTTLAGAAAGAKAGAVAAPFLGPAAPIAPLLGGGLGALTFAMPGFMGSNLTRQIEEDKTGRAPLNVGAAAAAALPQAGLDVAQTLFVLGRVAGLGGGFIKALSKKPAEVVEAELVKKAQESLLKAGAKGAAKGVATEVPTEVAQTILERAQAGLPLLDADARKEYEATAVASVGPGALFGGVGGGVDRGGARRDLAVVQARREAEDEAEKQRAEETRRADPAWQQNRTRELMLERRDLVSQMDDVRDVLKDKTLGKYDPVRKEAEKQRDELGARLRTLDEELRQYEPAMVAEVRPTLEDRFARVRAQRAAAEQKRVQELEDAALPEIQQRAAERERAREEAEYSAEKLREREAKQRDKDAAAAEKARVAGTEQLAAAQEQEEALRDERLRDVLRAEQERRAELAGTEIAADRADLMLNNLRLKNVLFGRAGKQLSPEERGRMAPEQRGEDRDVVVRRTEGQFSGYFDIGANFAEPTYDAEGKPVKLDDAQQNNVLKNIDAGQLGRTEQQVLGLKGLGGKQASVSTLEGAEVALPAIEQRINVLQGKKDALYAENVELNTPDGHFTKDGSRAVAIEAQLLELRKLRELAQEALKKRDSEQRSEVLSEQAIMASQKRTDRAGIVDYDLPPEEHDKAIEKSLETQQEAYDDIRIALSDIRSGNYLGSKRSLEQTQLSEAQRLSQADAVRRWEEEVARAKAEGRQPPPRPVTGQDVSESSKTKKQLGEEMDAARDAYANSVLEQVDHYRAAHGKPPLTNEEAIDLFNDVQYELDKLIYRQQQPKREMTQVLVSPAVYELAQMRSGKVVQGAKLVKPAKYVWKDVRPWEERPIPELQVGQVGVDRPDAGGRPIVGDAAYRAPSEAEVRPVSGEITDDLGVTREKIAKLKYAAMRGEPGERRANRNKELLLSGKGQQEPDAPKELDRYRAFVAQKLSRVLDRDNLLPGVRETLERAYDVLESGKGSRKLAEASEVQADRILRGIDRPFAASADPTKRGNRPGPIKDTPYIQEIKDALAEMGQAERAFNNDAGQTDLFKTDPRTQGYVRSRPQDFMRFLQSNTVRVLRDIIANDRLEKLRTGMRDRLEKVLAKERYDALENVNERIAEKKQAWWAAHLPEPPDTEAFKRELAVIREKKYTRPSGLNEALDYAWRSYARKLETYLSFYDVQSRGNELRAALAPLVKERAALMAKIPESFPSRAEQLRMARPGLRGELTDEVYQASVAATAKLRAARDAELNSLLKDWKDNLLEARRELELVKHERAYAKAQRFAYGQFDAQIAELQKQVDDTAGQVKALGEALVAEIDGTLRNAEVMANYRVKIAVEQLEQLDRMIREAEGIARTQLPRKVPQTLTRKEYEKDTTELTTGERPGAFVGYSRKFWQEIRKADAEATRRRGEIAKAKEALEEHRERAAKEKRALDERLNSFLGLPLTRRTTQFVETKGVDEEEVTGIARRPMTARKTPVQEERVVRTPGAGRVLSPDSEAAERLREQTAKAREEAIQRREAVRNRGTKRFTLEDVDKIIADLEAQQAKSDLSEAEQRRVTRELKKWQGVRNAERALVVMGNRPGKSQKSKPLSVPMGEAQRKKMREDAIEARREEQRVEQLSLTEDEQQALDDYQGRFDLGDTDFRAAEKGKPEKPVGAAEAQATADRIKKSLPTGIKFTYAATLDKAPIHLRMAAARRHVMPKGAVMPDGEVVVIGDMHDSVADLERTIAHELIGHYSVETILGEQGMRDLVKRVFKDGEEGALKLAGEMGVEPQVRAAIRTAEKGNEQMAATRELVAYVAERDPTPARMPAYKRMLKMVVDALRAALTKLGFTKAPAGTAQEIYDIIKKARDGYARNRLGAYTMKNGDIAFRSRVEYANVPAGVRDTVRDVVGQEKSLWDKVKANVSGVSGRMQWIDRFAGLEQVSRKMKDALAAAQMMYWLRIHDQRNNFMAQIASEGPLRVEEVKRPDGKTELMAKTTPGANLKKIATLLRGANVGNAEAANHLFTLYLASIRAKRVGLDALNFSEKVTKARMDEFERWINAPAQAQTKAIFDKARSIYNEYNRGLIEFAVQSGALSKREGAALAGTNDYIPFYRIENGVAELVIGGEGKFKIGNLRSQPYLKELVGGDTQILDFFTSSLQNTAILTDMSLRNIATRNTAFALQALKVGGKRAATISSGDGPAQPNVVRFKVDGEKRYAIISTEVFDKEVPGELVVKGMEGISTTLPFMIRAMQGPAAVLRKGVTRNPMYAVRQIVKDSLATLFTAGANAIPILTSLKNLYEMSQGQSKAEQHLKSSGILGGQVFTGSKEDMRAVMTQMAEGDSNWATLWATLDQLAIKGDAASRVTMYNSFKRQGLSDMEATLATLEAMNFNKRGLSPSIHWMAATVPFMHAQIQGLDVLYRAATGKMPFQERLKVKEKLMTRGLIMAGATLAYAAVMADDEAYKNADPHAKYNYWFIRVPGFDEAVKVPIPFEIGYLFKALPEMVANMLFRGETGANVQKALASMAINSIPGGMPQMIKPALEVVMNKSFFTGQAVEGTDVEGLMKSERYRTRTTELAKILGKAEILSPLQIDHLIRGYTGGLGTAVVSMVNPVLRTDVAGPVEGKSSELPIIGQLFQPTDGVGMINQAYDTVKLLEEKAKTFDKLVTEGREAEARALLERYSRELILAEAGSAFKRNMGQLTKLERAVRAMPERDMDRKTKREHLDQIRQAKISLSRELNESLAAFH